MGDGGQGSRALWRSRNPEWDITCERATYVFRHAGPPAEFLDSFRLYYGPTMNAFEAAARDGRAEQLREELKTVFEAQNQGGPERTIIPATYLKVSVKKS
jgi:hypothetical protein